MVLPRRHFFLPVVFGEFSINISGSCPLESEIIASDFYVDDLLTGASDLDSLINLKSSIDKFLSEYGFELRKFQSNDSRILDGLNETKHGNDEYAITDNSAIKILGASWVPNRDSFQYNSQNSLPNHD